jgi:hypothetical protein
MSGITTANIHERCIFVVAVINGAAPKESARYKRRMVHRTLTGYGTSEA